MKSLRELTARASALRACAAWQELQTRAGAADSLRLRLLLGAPRRFEEFSCQVGGCLLDYSRQRLTHEIRDLLLQLATERDLADWIDHLFSGEAVNSTERRAAQHMALRGSQARPSQVAGQEVAAAVAEELERFLALAGRLNAGKQRGASGESIADVVNIGIGGSDLGLVMATEALRPFCAEVPRTHFVSNIDGVQLADLLPRLQPAQTLFVICSKSFTTIETQLNAQAARNWLSGALGEGAVAAHFVAVSTNAPAMNEFGIKTDHRFRIWDWVGGRYSLWSAVGLSVAAAIGPAHFRELLGGAALMDEHFRLAPLAENLPVLLALLGIWNQNFLGAESHVVLPYDQRLHRLPAFLQQLEMESNGKQVTRDGRRVDWGTGTIVWGEPGSNSQHSFNQLLHQGTAKISIDFIAPANGSTPLTGQHLEGLANLVAQAEALARGRTLEEVKTDLAATGLQAAEVERIAPHKVHPGDRPSSVILLDQLEPRTLGMLVALYEHKVFAQSVIWGINPFDQWGVELGKLMAAEFSRGLRGEAAAQDSPGLVKVIRDRRRRG